MVVAREVAHLTIPGAGLVRVDDAGRRVTVEPEAAGDPSLLDAWIFGTVAAVVGAQQGRFALHASAIEVGDAVVAVAGDSGAGKSTTSLGLVHRGARLIADDVSMLEVSDDGAVTVEPYGRPLHLWPDTASAFGMDVLQADRVLPNTEKLSFASPPAAPTPVDAVAVLRRIDQVGPVRAVPMSGVAAAHAIAAHVYRRRFLLGVWHDELFAWATAVADRLQVQDVARPSEGWTLDAVLDSVEALASGPPTA